MVIVPAAIGRLNIVIDFAFFLHASAIREQARMALGLASVPNVCEEFTAVF